MLAGVLYDATGRPVPSACIAIYFEHGAPQDRRTNEHGEFRFDNIEAGVWDVYHRSTPSADAVLTRLSSERVDPAAEVWTALYLAGDRRLSGRVAFDAAGLPPLPDGRGIPIRVELRKASEPDVLVASSDLRTVRERAWPGRHPDESREPPAEVGEPWQPGTFGFSNLAPARYVMRVVPFDGMRVQALDDGGELVELVVWIEREFDLTYHDDTTVFVELDGDRLVEESLARQEEVAGDQNEEYGVDEGEPPGDETAWRR